MVEQIASRVSLASLLAAVVTQGACGRDAEKTSNAASVRRPSEVRPASRRPAPREEIPSRAAFLPKPVEEPEDEETPPPLSKSTVEDVVQSELKERDLHDGALVSVTCRSPPRCLAEIRGPSLGSDFPEKLAEDISEAAGVEYRFAASAFSHVQEGAQTPTHATFASFYLEGTEKSEAQDEVRRAVRAFKADLEAQE